MKVVILFSVVSLLCSANPQEDNSFGYEFLDSHLEHLDQKLTDLITAFSNISDARINELNEKVVRLTDLMKNNQIATENKITNLNSRLTDLIMNSQIATEQKISNLKSTSEAADSKLTVLIENNQKAAEKQINNLASTIGTNNSKLTVLIENNQKAAEKQMDNLASTIGTDKSNMINRLLKLEATGDTIISSHRSTENLIRGIKSSISTLDNQSKQILKNQHNLAIPSCSVPKVPGIYSLQFPRINVFCHPIIYGGGWLVIQHRYNGDTNFNRGWYEYRSGFGTIGSYIDFWLGLDSIHQITNGGEYELRVDVKNDRNEDKYALYSQFKVSSESDGYRLTIGGYSGTAGDEMSYHNQMKFSTHDWDNDESSNNCAKDFESGWWFKDCRTSNLNGPYKKGSSGFGIEWGYWANAGTYSRMMIRRK